MTEITLVIGGGASWADQQRGEVRSVVVNRENGTVTHLMVEPHGRQGLGRLVPFELVDGAAGEILLRCTEAEFESLPSAEVTEFAPGSAGYEKAGPVQLLPGHWSAAADSSADGADFPATSQTETASIVADLTGDQEVEEHRGDQVQATDGKIGRLYGLSIDPASGQVTHLLLKEHLWGRKTVAIPFSDVADLANGIRLNITKHQVEALSPPSS